MPSRRLIRPRRPVFLGCEGESEQAYGRLLADLIHEAGLAVHLEVVNLSPGAGDPVARLRRANQEINRRQQRRSEFSQRAVLIDLDQVQGNPQRRWDAETLARQLDIHIIWQGPCHESLILRHFEGWAHARPTSSQLALRQLASVWPEYNKPMTKIQLARKIGVAYVRRVATVEPELYAFLRNIGLTS